MLVTTTIIIIIISSTARGAKKELVEAKVRVLYNKIVAKLTESAAREAKLKKEKDLKQNKVVEAIAKKSPEQRMEAFVDSRIGKMKPQTVTLPDTSVKMIDPTKLYLQNRDAAGPLSTQSVFEAASTPKAGAKAKSKGAAKKKQKQPKNEKSPDLSGGARGKGGKAGGKSGKEQTSKGGKAGKGSGKSKGKGKGKQKSPSQSSTKGAGKGTRGGRGKGKGKA